MKWRKTNRSVAFLLILVLILSISLTGCGQEEQEAVTPDKSQEVKVITDQDGRQVEVPLEVDRVVSTWRPCTFLIYSVGGQSEIVGVDTGSTKSGFLLSAYPELADITPIGDKTHGVNMEAVVSTEPDVVFLFKSEDTQSTIDQLETQGIPAVVLFPESEKLMKEAVSIIGEVMGYSENAEKILTYFDTKLDEINQIIKNIPSEEQKTVYLAGAHGILSSCGNDFYQHFIIEQAGGINAAAELSGGWNDVSPEQLVAWNPDVIVADPYCKEGMDDAVRMDPALKSITAVKNDQLYSFPSVGQWSFPGPTSIMGIMWMAKTLYPDQFADMDFADEVDQFHQEFFGKTYTELGGTDLDGKGIYKQEKKQK